MLTYQFCAIMIALFLPIQCVRDKQSSSVSSLSSKNDDFLDLLKAMVDMSIDMGGFTAISEYCHMIDAFVRMVPIKIQKTKFGKLLDVFVTKQETIDARGDGVIGWMEFHFDWYPHLRREVQPILAEFRTKLSRQNAKKLADESPYLYHIVRDVGFYAFYYRKILKMIGAHNANKNEDYKYIYDWLKMTIDVIDKWIIELVRTPLKIVAKISECSRNANVASATNSPVALKRCSTSSMAQNDATTSNDTFRRSSTVNIFCRSSLSSTIEKIKNLTVEIGPFSPIHKENAENATPTVSESESPTVRSATSSGVLMGPPTPSVKTLKGLKGKMAKILRNKFRTKFTPETEDDESSSPDDNEDENANAIVDKHWRELRLSHRIVLQQIAENWRKKPLYERVPDTLEELASRRVKLYRIYLVIHQEFLDMVLAMMDILHGDGEMQTSKLYSDTVNWLNGVVGELRELLHEQ